MQRAFSEDFVVSHSVRFVMSISCFKNVALQSSKLNMKMYEIYWGDISICLNCRLGIKFAEKTYSAVYFAEL